MDGKQVRVGNLALAREAAAENLDWAEAALFAGAHSGQTRVIVLADGKPIGVIGLSDPLRPDAAEAVLRLKEMGISRILMVTGDEELAAKNIGRQAGIAEVYARLLPEDKAQKIRELRNEGLRILMAGDGVNDSPSLAVADVGLAMGRGAADISAEAAHVVFLKDRLEQIPDLDRLHAQDHPAHPFQHYPVRLRRESDRDPGRSLRLSQSADRGDCSPGGLSPGDPELCSLADGRKGGRGIPAVSRRSPSWRHRWQHARQHLGPARLARVFPQTLAQPPRDPRLECCGDNIALDSVRAGSWWDPIRWAWSGVSAVWP